MDIEKYTEIIKDSGAVHPLPDNPTWDDIKENFKWTTYGKDGRSSPKTVFLQFCSTSHLENIILHLFENPPSLNRGFSSVREQGAIIAIILSILKDRYQNEVDWELFPEEILYEECQDRQFQDTWSTADDPKAEMIRLLKSELP